MPRLYRVFRERDADESGTTHYDRKNGFVPG